MTFIDNDDRMQVSPLLDERGEISELVTLRSYFETGVKTAIRVTSAGHTSLYFFSECQLFHCFTIDGQFTLLNLLHDITPYPLLINPLLERSNLDGLTHRGFVLVLL